MSDKNNSAMVEISMLADRINHMMDEVKSTYSPAKELVLEARRNLFIDPPKSAKLMRKAFAQVEEEYHLAGEMERCRSTFSVNMTMDRNSDISVLEKEFRSLIRQGQYSKAGKTLEAVKELMDKKDLRNHLALHTVSNIVTDGRVDLRLTNLDVRDLTIDRIVMNTFDATIVSQVPIIRSLKRQASVDLPVELKDMTKSPILISVTIGYQVDMDEHVETLNVNVFLSEEAEESP